MFPTSKRYRFKVTLEAKVQPLIYSPKNNINIKVLYRPKKMKHRKTSLSRSKHDVNVAY